MSDIDEIRHENDEREEKIRAMNLEMETFFSAIPLGTLGKETIDRNATIDASVLADSNNNMKEKEKPNIDEKKTEKLKKEWRMKEEKTMKNLVEQQRQFIKSKNESIHQRNVGSQNKGLEKNFSLFKSQP